MSRTTRLFELLQLLRRHSLPVTAASLARDLGVSERTLYRDIAELVAQGAPIFGEAGVGYVLRPGLFLPPLMLTDDEIEAVVLGLRYVDQRGDAVLAAAGAEALAKIRAVLPPRGVETLDSPSLMPGPSGKGFPDTVVDLDSLRAAIRLQRKLRIDYADAGGARTTRTVWPIALGFLNDARLLAGWCEERNDFRTFRSDRISSAVETGERYPGRRAALLKAMRARMQPGEDDARTPVRN